MVKCNLSPHEFIRNAFTPQIGVICSPQAEVSCRKNNLSFIELLHPFCKLGSEVQFRDGTGTSSMIRNFRVTLVDVNFRPPHPVVAKKYLHSSVSQYTECRTQAIQAGDYTLNVPYFVPWYDAWRETFLQVQYPSDHEYTKHFLGCILVVSSADQNPLAVVNTMVTDLNAMQGGSNTQTKLPKWFSKNVMRYFVILHETASGVDDVKLVEIYDSLKAAYDSPNCFLLHTNSRHPPPAHLDADEQQPPDPWAQFLQHRIPLQAAAVAQQLGDVAGVPAGNRSLTPDSSPGMARSMMHSFEAAEEVLEGAAGDRDVTVYHPLSPDGDGGDLQTNKDIGAEFDTTAISAATVTAPVLHGAHLSTEDVEQLKLLIHEFCTQALLPHLERQTHQLHEAVVNRKGVSKSLLTATKRWFTPNKPSAATINTVTYSIDSPEIQVRKLGDLYFMVGVYSLAYQAYHTAKRDFNTDQAWLYYAAALEMAALAAFMANESNKKTFDYMEEGINTYLNTCKLPQFATRATILSVECLKARQLHGQAAHQLNRMTSEESDLRSALLLEQAAYCFLEGASTVPAAGRGSSSGSTGSAAPASPTAASGERVGGLGGGCLVRKYAFHMVLAGHRYSKAAQRRHSLRCYGQAQEIYRGRGWRFAEDHIYYTIGRQANITDRHDEALQFYSLLLTGESKQSPQQQEVFLRDYLNIYNSFLQNNDPSLAPVLPLPLIDNESIKVLVGPATPLRTAGKVSAQGITFTDEDDESKQRWLKLEEMLAQEAQGTLPMTFKPVSTLFTNTNISSVHPTAVLGEPIKVALKLHNPLQILLHLTDIYLIWKFTDSSNHTISNEVAAEHTNHQHTVRTHIIKTAALQANLSQELVLQVTPLSTGQLVLRGICYSILSMGGGGGSGGGGGGVVATSATVTVTGKRLFEVKGPRVKRKEHLTPDWRPDRRLTIRVVPTAPCLQVSFGELTTDLLRSETQLIPIELRNIGSIPLHRVHLATSVPHLLSSCDLPLSANVTNRYASVDLPAVQDNPVLREREARRYHVIGPLPLEEAAGDEGSGGGAAGGGGGVLEPGQGRAVTVWLRAPDAVGAATVDLFVYYESVDASIVPRYRIVRHIWHLVIQESISIVGTVKPSCNSTNVEQITIGVNTTNLNMIHHAVSTEISLLSIALLGKNWRLLPQPISTDATRLLAQESVHILLRAQRESGKGNLDANTHYSEVRFNNEDATQKQYSKALLDFARREECHKINIFEDIVLLQERIQRKYDATMVLKWQAFITDSCGTRRTVYGQTTTMLNMNDVVPASVTPFIDVPLDNSSSSKNTFLAYGALLGADTFATDNTAGADSIIDQRQLDRLRRQLNYNLVHIALVRHNFHRTGVCVVPVQLYVHNVTGAELTVTIHTIGTSSDTALTYTTNDTTTSSSSKTTLQPPTLATSSAAATSLLCVPCASGQHFRWTRAGSLVRTLPPLATVRVQLAVAVLGAGTYDLAARLQLWCQAVREPPAAVLQACRPHSALVVTDDGNGSGSGDDDCAVLT